MKLQRLLSYVRRAIDDYQMIDDGDKIAVGVSGGKDSICLLLALKHLQRFYPKHFTLEAITVSLGLPGATYDDIAALCKSIDVPYTVVNTDIGQIIFDERKEKNPCSLCAKMRKGAFNEMAKKLSCNKVAYAHHKDDIIETMLMSLLFEGRFHTFSPVTYLDRMDLTVIRPLMYVDEIDIKGFQNKYHLPVQKNPCPADGYTKREYAKNLVKQLNQEHLGAKEHMFHAIVNATLPGWKKPV